MTVTPDAALLDDLAGNLSGRVLRPGDDGYDAARRVHNGLVDRTPAVIVRCRSAADAAAGVRFARAAGSTFVSAAAGTTSPRPCGRGRRGDDRPRRDQGRRRSTWRVAAYARKEASRGRSSTPHTAEHGLAVTGGAISTTGIAGLTLGGGTRLADGEARPRRRQPAGGRARERRGRDPRRHRSVRPDLFWALRGGGGNFGVATTFTYRLHPVAMVTGGLIAHPIDAAPDLLRFYRDAVADSPDDLTVFAVLAHAPDGSGMKLAAMAVFHTGERGAGRPWTWLRSRRGARH